MASRFPVEQCGERAVSVTVSGPMPGVVGAGAELGMRLESEGIVDAHRRWRVGVGSSRRGVARKEVEQVRLGGLADRRGGGVCRAIGR